jgi:F0F1-type ATP synthase membrane subunit b/b'
MTSTNPEPQENKPAVSQQTRDLVKQKMPNESDEVQAKMEELVEAMKKRAQSEIQTAGESTREAYMNAVRRARESLQQTSNFAEQQRNSVEEAVNMLEDEAKNNWDSILKEMEDFGDRLSQAAESAWNILTKKDASSDSSSGSSSSSSSS